MILYDTTCLANSISEVMESGL